MDYKELYNEISLKDGFLSIKRISKKDTTPYNDTGCFLRLLLKAFEGETLYFSKENVTCPGAAIGLGFTDGLPPIPGGFGYFISSGRGEGYPPGEKVKCSPEIGERMLLNQPRNVLDEFDCIRIKKYEPGIDSDIVTSLVTPDQLSALIHIFNFRKADYDNIIAPMVSGCASIFRIPFGELKKDEPRGVIGNIDVFSRPHFAMDKFFFTIPGKCFETMITDADESILTSHIWKGIKSRI